MPKLWIASDHGGWELKEKVKQFSAENCPQWSIQDLGTDSGESCDFPAFGAAVAQRVAADPEDRGIVICGSGVGISIAVNRIRGAHAVLANSLELVQLGREHNNANVLALGGRTKFFDPWEQLVTAFLQTPALTEERYQKRRAQLDQLDLGDRAAS